ncbi:hypothetical protein HDU84_001176 [Entophlyctis sp. JEL0112]|nr:hypothetical protein HDU84_001176 [Entophlyctis sp. JEL0112]
MRLTSLNVDLRRKILVLSSLCAESSIGAAEYARYGSLFSGAFSEESTICLAPEDCKEDEKAVFAVVQGATSVPPARTTNQRDLCVKYFGEKGLQQIAFVSALAAMTTTMADLLCPEMDETLQQSGEKLLSGTGWTCRLQKPRRDGSSAFQAAPNNLKSVDEIAAMQAHELLKRISLASVDSKQGGGGVSCDRPTPVKPQLAKSDDLGEPGFERPGPKVKSLQLDANGTVPRFLAENATSQSLQNQAIFPPNETTHSQLLRGRSKTRAFDSKGSKRESLTVVRKPSQSFVFEKSTSMHFSTNQMNTQQISYPSEATFSKFRQSVSKQRQSVSQAIEENYPSILLMSKMDQNVSPKQSSFRASFAAVTDQITRESQRRPQYSQFISDFAQKSPMGKTICTIRSLFAVSCMANEISADIPRTSGALDRFVRRLFGFSPKYIQQMKNISAKRSLCYVLNTIIFSATDSNKSSGHPYLLSLEDKFIIGFIFFMSIPNYYLAAHFATLIADKTSTSASSLAQMFEAAKTFNTKCTDTPKDVVSITKILAAKVAVRDEDHFDISPQLYRVSKHNPWAVTEAVSLLSVFALLHRYTAIVENNFEWEKDVERVVYGEFGKEIGLNNVAPTVNIGCKQNVVGEPTIWGGNVAY